MNISRFVNKLHQISLTLTVFTVLGLCVSQSANAASLSIANSVSEFSGIQGENNWYYGYYDGSFTSASFKQMTQYDGTWWVQNGSYWTNLWNTGGHPNGNPSVGGRIPHPQWAVRRWVSEIDGEVTIFGKLAEANPFGTGDGQIGQILVDGMSIWSQYIANADLVGVNYSLNASVKKGSFVDLAIAPNVSDWDDGAIFTATISIQEKIKQVPDPSSVLAILAFGTFGASSLLKRKQQQKVLNSVVSE